MVNRGWPRQSVLDWYFEARAKLPVEGREPKDCPGSTRSNSRPARAQGFCAIQYIFSLLMQSETPEYSTGSYTRAGSYVRVVRSGQVRAGQGRSGQLTTATATAHAVGDRQELVGAAKRRRPMLASQT